MRPLVCTFLSALSTDVFRYKFDLFTSSDGSNDPVAAFRWDVRWLHNMHVL